MYIILSVAFLSEARCRHSRCVPTDVPTDDYGVARLNTMTTVVIVINKNDMAEFFG